MMLGRLLHRVFRGEAPARHAAHMLSRARRLERLGRRDEARASLAAAVSRAPADVGLLEELALFSGHIGELELARESALRALEADSGSIAARLCLGNIRYREDRFDESIDIYREALRIQPDNASVHYNLGLALQTRGDTIEAIEHYRRTVALLPDLPDEHSTLLFLLNADPRPDPAEILEEHLRWGRRFGDPLLRRERHRNSPDPERRLRVGYVSGDFVGHAASAFIAPILERHDRARFDVVGFVNAQSLPDTGAYPGCRWHRILDVPDEQVRGLIQGEAIDILVDLSGHTTRNRLLLFARKPAPVQITVLGYPNTTGLAAMDYRLTDTIGDPPGGSEGLYCEQLLRMPACLWCYSPSSLAPAPMPAPSVQAGYATFGSINAAYKLNDRLFEAWREILREVPRSRMIVSTIPKGEAQARVRRRFADAGIDPSRIEVVERLPLTEHWKLVGRLDLALDSFPCNGGATTCEALWLGVPTLTMAGRTFRERAGMSLLSNLGLDELVSRDIGEYVGKAVELGRNPGRLAALRTDLRERMRASPILDAARYVEDLESLYRQAWRGWCGGAGAGRC